MAKGFYFDFGAGYGWVDTSLKNAIPTDEFFSIYYAPSKKQDFGNMNTSFGVRLGYEFIDRLVVISDFQMIDFYRRIKPHLMLNENPEGLQFLEYKERITNAYMGFGLLYYINTNVLVGVTVGPNSLTREIPHPGLWFFMHDTFSSQGVGSDVSIAYDISFRYLSLLVGGRMFFATGSAYTVTTGKANNTPIPQYFTTDAGWHTTSLGLFTKIKF